MGVHSSKVAPQGGFEQGEASGVQRPEQEDWPEPWSESRADPEAATGPQQLPASAGQPEQVLDSKRGFTGPGSPGAAATPWEAPLPHQPPGAAPRPGLPEDGAGSGLAPLALPAGAPGADGCPGYRLTYLHRETEENLEEQYTSLGSPGKAELHFVQAHFSNNEFHLFSPLWSSAEVNFASILVMSNTTNLLDQVIFSEMSQLDEAVQTLTAPWEDGTQVLYPQVCARYQSTCMPSNPLLFIWQKNNIMDLKSITFPIYNTSAAPLYLANLLGGTVLGPGAGTSRLLL
ncbi:patched domain-containing protein 3-like [Talpa occidentalis]|uniref:patched domain-containing protein 3-like n=1 Tax=Talpa occidentalis TaxID=50954 RepID=UPI0023F9585E|nr:patched domain-containing protein 3-like [Talpa occidentalis]